MEQKFARPVNFRDLGGVVTQDKKTVKRGRLLRSGEVTGLNDSERDMLIRKYQLRVVVDFRTPGEIKLAPDDVFDGVRYVPIDLFEGDAEQASNMENYEHIKTKQQALDFMFSAYEALANNEAAHRNYIGFLREVLQNREGSLLFHCFAGKDRTGVAAAILYTLLGVSKEAIFEEYMLSNVLRKEWNTLRMEQAVAQGATRQDIEVMEGFFYVRPEYLQRMYSIVEQKHGSFLSFIQSEMRVSDEDIQNLRENYLE